MSVAVLSGVRLEGRTPVLERLGELWILKLGEGILARSRSRNELLDWALFGQGAKGVMTVPSPGWDFRKDDT